MSVEESIETAIRDYLEENMPEQYFETIIKSTNFDEMQIKAERWVAGGAFVMYYGSPQYIKQGNSRVYRYDAHFLIRILNKNRREHNGIYSMVSQIRDLMYNYKYQNKYHFDVIREMPSDFPSETGFYVDEIELTIPLIYPMEYTNESNG